MLQFAFYLLYSEVIVPQATHEETDMVYVHMPSWPFYLQMEKLMIGRFEPSNEF